ncbi:FHA domain-containing protein [Ditylenchus destructor]|uniref:FHA domain-containing protein n=1 Tax=Ditylenchus destructor TaxID=166010 RepID=A0AAD4R1I2_9BILA|nr:FHA domain-containing protein [Ditylenchus destructor]
MMRFKIYLDRPTSMEKSGLRGSCKTLRLYDLRSQAKQQQYCLAIWTCLRQKLTISLQQKKWNSRLQHFLYTAPSWQCEPSKEDGFYIDVIKNGIVAEKIELHSLKNGSFLCIGRFPPSDIQLEHPSVSRYHCILQYGKLVDDPNWYIYDLGSTHGTRLNKKPLKKHSYTPLRHGYVFQIAGSSRVFSFYGEDEADDDQPPVTEKPVQGPADNDVKSVGSEDVNDAAQDAETKTEAKYYEKDPIGWLDKYFEREGLPMNFQYTKSDTASDFVCSIELADDVSAAGGNLVSASAFTRKLAQFQCSLVACERLDAHGLLRTFSIWNKKKTYVDNDYYDSDEDTFYDRTGQIEEQRRKRKTRIEGGGAEEKSKTYTELNASLAEAENNLTIIRTEIQRLIGKNTYTDAEGNVSSTSTNFSTRMAVAQMKSKEKKFMQECEQLKKIVALVKPHETPISTETHTKEDSLEQIPSTSEENKGTELNEQHTESSLEQRSPVERAEILPDDVISEPAPKRERNYGPAMPEIIQPKFGILTKEEARIKHPTRVKRKQQVLEDELKDSDYSDMPLDLKGDYATWLPPESQSGDGSTKLNKKFEGRY